MAQKDSGEFGSSSLKHTDIHNHSIRMEIDSKNMFVIIASSVKKKSD